MSLPCIALIADPTSSEGCREYLAQAVELLTGAPPVRVAARHFADGGSGRAVPEENGLRLHVPEEGLDFRPDIVLLYEIPPHRRAELAAFQNVLHRPGVVTLDAGPEAWRTATEKNLTVERFQRDGIAQMETVVLSRPSPEEAEAALDKLGGDAWARPVSGTGGDETFHVTTNETLRLAAEAYAAGGTDWMLSRDAGNITADGSRHQFRVFVLHGRVIHAREHIQPSPDTPCNTSRGATPVHLDPADLSPRLASLAIAATASVGLPFAGVDLVPENGGVVFEVNIHPAFVDGEVELQRVAVPYVRAHLDALARGGDHPGTLPQRASRPRRTGAAGV
ncbi:MAG TPA: alpha-L-glutamate ligase [Streptomyces sp.]|nr:alpha-L-glutamate ligase [Streptomyces sp.]